jgi:hypothetical protein
MVKKIDFSKICLDNLRTFRSHDTNKLMVSDFLLFLAFPVVLSVIIIASKFELKENFVTAMITAASIFAGLLLNLLVLIYTIFISDREKIEARLPPDKYQIWIGLIRETFANVSFCILVSIIIVALSLLFYLDLISIAKIPVVFFLFLLFFSYIALIYGSETYSCAH